MTSATVGTLARPGRRTAFGLSVIQGGLVVLVIGALLLLTPWWVAALLIVLAAWFVSPGAVLVGRLCGWRSATAMWLVAPVWGFLLSSLTLLALWAMGLRHWSALLPAPVLAVPLAWVGGALSGRLRPPRLVREDAWWLPATLALVPVLVGWPYARVGELGPDGASFRAYFTADFVWAMAAVAEVAKGALPPVNPFLQGEALHYYWLAHLFPAAEYRLLDDVLSLRQLLLANAVLSGLVFAGFLYALARHFSSRAWACALAVAVAVLATSFEGLQQLVSLWQAGRPLDLVRYINIDAVSRWVFHGMPVDGLQRVLFYQPQHQLGYASAISALLLAAQTDRPHDWRIGLLTGSVLALSLLTSTFSAFMVTAAAALYLGGRLLTRERWPYAPLVALAAAVPLMSAIVLSASLQYVDRGGSLVIFGLNPVATRNWPTVWALSFGPLLLAAAALAAAGLRARRAWQGTGPVWALAVVCIVFYFAVDVRDHQDVYVGWRAGHLLCIAFVAIVARLTDLTTALAPRGRALAAAGGLLVVAAALPTTAIDWYNTQDTLNRGPTPFGRWTLVLSHDELAALAWIRANTPPEAVVQVDPRARESETWAYVPAFAERRMAAGLPISMIPMLKYRQGTERVEHLFSATSAQEAEDVALANGIDYVLIGPPERRHAPGLEALLDADSERFTLAFRNDAISLYHVARAARFKPHPRRG